jgi:hypothetical protein
MLVLFQATHRKGCYELPTYVPICAHLKYMSPLKWEIGPPERPETLIIRKAEVHAQISPVLRTMLELKGSE